MTHAFTPTRATHLPGLPPAQPIQDWPSLCDVSMPFRLPPLGMALIPTYFDLCCSVSRTTGVPVNDLTATDEDGIRVMHPCLAGVVHVAMASMNDSQMDELRSRARHAAFLCRGVGHRTQEQIRKRRVARRKAEKALGDNGAPAPESQPDAQLVPDFQIPWVSSLSFSPQQPPLPPLFQQFTGDATDAATDALLEAVDLCSGGSMPATLTDPSTGSSCTPATASTSIVPELSNSGFSIQRVHASTSPPVYFPAPNTKIKPEEVDLLPWVPMRSVSPRLYARTVPLLPGYREAAASVAAVLHCFARDLHRSEGTVRYMHPRFAVALRAIVAGLSDDEIAAIGVRGRAKFKEYRERHEQRIGYKCYQPHAKRNRKGIAPILATAVDPCVPVVHPAAVVCGPLSTDATAQAQQAVLDRRSESAFSTPVRVPTPVVVPSGAPHRPAAQMPTWMVQIILDARAGATTLTV